eukprot:4718496-Pyramimonas_sp.AAC.1
MGPCERHDVANRGARLLGHRAVVINLEPANRGSGHTDLLCTWTSRVAPRDASGAILFAPPGSLGPSDPRSS